MDEARHINGQVFHAEKGRIGIYSDSTEVKQIFNAGDIWDIGELAARLPSSLLLGYGNPAPPEPVK